MKATIDLYLAKTVNGGALEMLNDLPARKRLRLVNYDYSQNGAYFITICIKGRHKLLGTIIADPAGHPTADAAAGHTTADAVGDAVLSVPNPRRAPPRIQLSEIGVIVKEFLDNMNTANESLQLENYVIMPNHIHLLIMVASRVVPAGGTLRTASPTRVTHVKGDRTKAMIPQIVHGLKSFTTRRIGETIWQRSYHDHIVRNEEEYKKIWDYIDTNVQSWQMDCFYDN